MLKRRRPAPIPRPDLTPFVSIAFLLIIFFVWVKQLQRLNQMQIEFLEEEKFIWSYPNVCASLFLLANNRIGFLTYSPDESTAEFSEIDYTNGILQKHLDHLISYPKSIILISPTELSTLKNVADVINEIQKSGHLQFVLSSKLTTGEQRMLKAYERHKKLKSQKPFFIYISLYEEGIIDA